MIWREIYSHFDPVAFTFLGFKIHWYALAYITALLCALYLGRAFVRLEERQNPKAKPFFSLDEKLLFDYFFWVEVGVLLGARIGYILIYVIPYEEGALLFYLTQPWQMFNPYYNGVFVGIRGMSFHGALLGALLSSLWFAYRHKKDGVSFWRVMDLVGLSVPLGYVFGRIGNFLNQELVGRETDVAWAISVHGILRHPSQLYEAFLEGVVVFVIVYAYYKIYRTRERFCGQIGALFLLAYALMRFVAEFYREPDSQIGFVLFAFSMGQILSLLMAGIALVLFVWRKNRARCGAPSLTKSAS
ncbi:MAG: prolipoprotein diacylglyceryl transferase [Helicobacter sp.]|nr:prolipoprotein diacylglyceryl transferase [Helicobacter sp.]